MRAAERVAGSVWAWDVGDVCSRADRPSPEGKAKRVVALVRAVPNGDETIAAKVGTPSSRR